MAIHLTVVMGMLMENAGSVISNWKPSGGRGKQKFIAMTRMQALVTWNLFHEVQEAHLDVNCSYMSCGLNSFKAVIHGMIKGTTMGDITGDTRSLDYGLHRIFQPNILTNKGQAKPQVLYAANFWGPYHRIMENKMESTRGERGTTPNIKGSSWMLCVYLGLFLVLEHLLAIASLVRIWLLRAFSGIHT